MHIFGIFVNIVYGLYVQYLFVKSILIANLLNINNICSFLFVFFINLVPLTRYHYTMIVQMWIQMNSFKTRFLASAFATGVLVIAVHAQIKSVEPPIMGWSSWNTYRVNINEELIKKQADAMISQGLKDVGYNFVNIDDGFFGHRDEGGWLHTHPERFPNGVKIVVDYIHSKGLKAGIYSEAGANTCGSIWDADKNGIGVGLYGFERQDADIYFNQWGFDFIKIDYCGAGQQLELDEKERYMEIVNAIREVCPRNISLNICRWAYPGTWVKNLARSWRVSPDITPNWCSIKQIISMNMYLSAYAGGGHYNDMDMLEIGRGLTREEEETHFGMWCIMSSPMLIGCDLTKISESSLELLKNEELIALNQDPLGLQAYVVQHEGNGYVFVKDIEREMGKMRAVALYNPSDEVCSFNVPLSVLELQGKSQIRDLVQKKDECTVKDAIRFKVKPHGVKILRVEAEKRIERTVYEAEQAFLNQFDALGKRKRGVNYMPFEGASGRMTVCNLGGHKDNFAEWNNVFSEKGGKYKMIISYIPAEIGKKEIPDRRLEVTVNRTRTSFSQIESDRSKGVQTVELIIELQPGYNVIRMGSRLTWSPDIDCFVLEKMNHLNPK